MGISKLSVKRGVAFTMLYTVIVGFGLFSLVQLKLDLFPELKFPIVAIVASYEGVNPEEIETLVTRPIEMSLAAVKNIKKIRSTSKHGNAMVMVDLEWGTDIDKAVNDMREKLDMAEDSMPNGMRKPYLFAFDPSLQPILMLAVRSPKNTNTIHLREYLEKRITPLLERIPGVASVQVQGGKKRQIQVLVNPNKVKALGISMSQVVQALRAANLQIASGSVKVGRRELSLSTDGTFQTIKQIGRVVVGMKGQPAPKPVYLEQIATIKDTHEEQTRILRSQGNPTMMLMVQKRSDANTVQTAQAVLKELPKIQKRLPKGVLFKTVFNQSDFVVRSISNLSSSAGQAFFLAILVLLVFLRSFRSSLIVGLSIPVSVIATFSVMYLANITLNIISMAGLALAVGMLVDNSIVVLENVFRHLEQGKSSWEAAIQGSQEVITAITASTLTTLAVFVPILFVPGLAGMLFRDMVITICFSLTASLLVAITLIPLLASRVLKVKPAAEVTDEASSGGFLGWLDRTYSSALSWSLRFRKTTIFIGFGSLVVALGLGQFIQTEFIPKSDDGMIMLNYEGSPGATLEETVKTGADMETLIRKRYGSSIETIVVESGVGEGLSALFGKGAHAGMLRIRLKPRSQRSLSKHQIMEGLRKTLKPVAGIKLSFQQNGLSGGSDIEIQLFGHDLKTGKALAQKVKAMVQTVPGTRDVKTSLEEGQPGLNITLHRQRMQTLGLNISTVGNTISTAFKGTVATLLRQADSEYQILVRLQQKYRRSIKQIRDLAISTPAGKTIPLSSIADVRYTLRPVKIERLDQQRVATVHVSVNGGNLGKVTTAIRARMAKFQMPSNFSYKVGGQAEDFAASFLWLAVAFFVAIALVYMVMAGQFESYFEPFIILFSIPLSLIGVILALLLTQTPLSIMGFVGIIMLVGIVVNNAIVLLDFIKQNRADHNTPVLEACLEAGRVRLRPILMTAATTIFGMLPLALGLGDGAENWIALGRVVIGGLLTSTFLTLFVVPTLYASMTLFFEKHRQNKA
ncbi:MAG: efflux RND transporter permease subunit [Deltaproteobacteria bacterium]|nr:MAG: efflux RND transporter permease subunit [Deltaproteobacteria bacterium]